jgi:hypothetical protein
LVWFLKRRPDVEQIIFKKPKSPSSLS